MRASCEFPQKLKTRVCKSPLLIATKRITARLVIEAGKENGDIFNEPDYVDKVCRN
jgi:hypothetical protein